MQDCLVVQLKYNATPYETTLQTLCKKSGTIYQYNIIIRDLKYAYDWKMAIDIGSVAQTLNDQIFVLLHN